MLYYTNIDYSTTK